MANHGEGGKQVWSTEYGAPTGRSSVSVTEAQQAQMVSDSYSGITQWAWAGPLLWYSYRDQGTDATNPEDNFGLARYDRTTKQAWGTFLATMQGGSASTTTSTTIAPTTTTTQPTTSTTTVSNHGHGGGGGSTGSGSSVGGGGRKKK